MGFSLKLARAPKAEKQRARRQGGGDARARTPISSATREQLSGGQRQRVAMGRAMVRNPKVFLFDEPLSNLDAKLRVQMRSEIKQNHQRLKTTTVYVTHDQIEAMTMADRIVVMHDGVVEQIGTPLELYDHPANLFVAGFIGSPAMNVLAGRIEDGGFVADGRHPHRAAPQGRRRTAPRSRLGIRPEHFRLDPDGWPPRSSPSSRPGRRPRCTCGSPATSVVGVFRERIAERPGETLRVSPDPERLHLFDAGSGQRIAA